ncbi:long-chain-fatty-acid--CoA ligase [Parafrankia sp. EUN1f]|uniref:long-chain-fatty-acid--CoA ligase n=1 Tax=Parafrankia sp. EUN1f TaxID=102897 RepID=UPI0001C47418|nr:long-chain-fatty-acid--CoA ligase [Parafrankia sp. EUN1f]EFC86316.1 AMP-dependent synthetase and ligase [Parafrankia sp. EUN1f]
MAELLLEGIDRARLQNGRVVFLGTDSEDSLGWSEFFADAERVAAWLQGERGVGPGSRVVVLASPSREMVTALTAVWMAGGSVTCAPTPARTVDLATYAEQTRDRVAALGSSLVLLGSPYEDLGQVLAAGGARVDPLAQVMTAEPAGAWKRPDLTSTDLAIAQFTSGTTADPKIVQISHGNLAANIAAIRERGRHDEVHGGMLSWLPLSHDMGLIGGLALHLTCGRCDVLFSRPEDYLAAPSSWMGNAARHRATVLVGPASAYALAGRLLAVGPQLDLSSVRLALCGGEPIEPEAIERFLDAAARHGLDRNVFLPAYGLAEATLAVTMPPAPGLRLDEINTDLLADRGLAVPASDAAQSDAPARRLVRLGPPMAGLHIRVVDPATGQPLPERAVGEIHIRGESVTAGYLENGGPEPRSRNQNQDQDFGGVNEGVGVRRLEDGWLATGDLGYLVDGELVACGRAKDLIIIGGRNLHPEEIEQAAGRVPGVRPGNVVAYAIALTPGASTEGVTIAAEVRPGHDEATIRAEVTAAVLASVGVRPGHVHLLPPGSIPKTPSGKLQRARAATMFGSGR